MQFWNEQNRERILGKIEKMMRVKCVRTACDHEEKKEDEKKRKFFDTHVKEKVTKKLR